ncbi:hypothetical protein JCM10296v2_001734 [Rhodotorula toruloides]
MPIKLFDLVPQPGGVFFSPSCLRARLALSHKQLPFEVEEVTYHDLRFIWKDRLGVQKATAPIIQREDGSYLMDSDKIAAYLDKEYPDRPNLFIPEAIAPVDLDSDEYSKAKQAAADYHANMTPHRSVWGIFAPLMAKLFDAETRTYWTGDARLGEGVWAKVSSRSEEERDEIVKQLHGRIKEATADRLANENLFFTSPSKPGYTDFYVLSDYRLLRSVSAKLAYDVYGADKRFAAWLERMKEAYLMPEVWERDPNE